MLDVSLFSHIAFHARLAPRAPAVCVGGKEIPYARFRDDIEAITALLAREQFPPGTRAAILVNRRYLNWTVTLACMRVKLQSVNIEDAKDYAETGATLLLTDAEEIPEGVKAVRITQDSFAEGARLDRPRLSPPEGESVCRIVVSTGAMGRPLKVPVTHAQLRQSSLNAAAIYRLGPMSRVLAGFGMGTLGGFFLPCSAWFAGGCTVLRAPDLAEAYRTGKPTTVVLAPTFLEKLVADAGPDAKAPGDAPAIFVGGAPLRDALNEAARERLSASLFVLYGSTEVATATLAPAAAVMERPGCVGFPAPFTEVEVVDDDRRRVPPGTEGVVRIRAEAMATRYIDDKEATDKAFISGWFYPGDRGRFDKAGALHLTGRVDQLANLGGLKLAPERIDEVLKALPGVKDAAAFHVPGETADELWLAVVEGEGFDGKAVRAAYAEAFPRQPFPKLMKLEELPRDDAGRVLRGRLRQAVLKSKGAKIAPK